MKHIFNIRSSNGTISELLVPNFIIFLIYSMLVARPDAFEKYMKADAIKLIRQHLNLGLYEAKFLVEFLFKARMTADIEGQVSIESEVIVTYMGTNHEQMDSCKSNYQ